MAFIPVPNTVHAELVFNQQGQVVENNLYFYCAVDPTVEMMADLADILADWWHTHVATVTANSTALTTIKVTSLEQAFAPGIETPLNPPDPGLVNSPGLPNNATLVTTFVTGLRGRSFRGRNYFIGLAEGMVVGNVVDALQVTNINAGYENLLLALAGTDWSWVVVSRYSDKQPRDIGVVTDVVTTKSDGIIDSQRRRLPGRGR